jgi:hypothetical protein
MTAPAQTTLKDSVLETAALIKKIVDDYDLTPEIAHEIYKWDVSTYLSGFGQRAATAQEITNDAGGNEDGGNVVSIDGSPVD